MFTPTTTPAPAEKKTSGNNIKYEIIRNYQINSASLKKKKHIQNIYRIRCAETMFTHINRENRKKSQHRQQQQHT